MTPNLKSWHSLWFVHKRNQKFVWSFSNCFQSLISQFSNCSCLSEEDLSTSAAAKKGFPPSGHRCRATLAFRAVQLWISLYPSRKFQQFTKCFTSHRMSCFLCVNSNFDYNFEENFQLREVMPCVSIVNPKPPFFLLPGSNEAVRNLGGKTKLT